MPLDLIGLVGRSQLLVVGASRAGLPTRPRSQFFFKLRFGRLASEAFALSLAFLLSILGQARQREQKSGCANDCENHSIFHGWYRSELTNYG